MHRFRSLPPRWPGAAMIVAGVFGLVFMVNPAAAGVALLAILLTIALLGSLGALAALAMAERADEAMGVTEEEIAENARRYADDLRDALRAEEAETSAAAVIADDDFPARVGRGTPNCKGGDTGTQLLDPDPGANLSTSAGLRTPLSADPTRPIRRGTPSNQLA